MAGSGAGRADATESAGRKAEMTMGQNVVAFILAALVAAGSGATLGLLAPGPSAPVRASSTPGAKSVEARIVDMGSIDLPPVVTNLATPPEIWVRIEGTLLFEGKTLPHVETLAGQISGDILAFMRTQTLSQIQGVAGLQHLRQDLNERVAIRSEGKVREFIIKSLVVQ